MHTPWHLSRPTLSYQGSVFNTRKPVFKNQAVGFLHESSWFSIAIWFLKPVFGFLHEYNCFSAVQNMWKGIIFIGFCTVAPCALVFEALTGHDNAVNDGEQIQLEGF